MFEVSQHGWLVLSTEPGRRQLGDVTLWPPAPTALPPSPAIPLPGPLFLGPRGTEQLVDAGSLLSSKGDAWDMGLEVGLGDNPGAG